jgi:hypothetical protein
MGHKLSGRQQINWHQPPLTSIYDVPSARVSEPCSWPAATTPHAKPSSSAHASSPSTEPCLASSNPPRSSPDSLRHAANPEQPSSASPRSWSSDREHPAESQPAAPCSAQSQSPASATARHASPREHVQSPPAQTHLRPSRAIYPPPGPVSQRLLSLFQAWSHPPWVLRCPQAPPRSPRVSLRRAGEHDSGFHRCTEPQTLRPLRLRLRRSHRLSSGDGTTRARHRHRLAKRQCL